MPRRTKLLLLIPHLGGGGAEYVTAQLACHLDPRLFEIHLGLVSADCDGTPAIPPWVTIHRLHHRRVRNAWRSLLRTIRDLQPDVIFSGMAHLNFLVLALRPLLPRRVRILVRQNTTASSAAPTWLSRLPYRVLYPLADMILCQSRAMAEDLVDNFAITRSRIAVLDNPIEIETIRSATHTACKISARPAAAAPRLLCVSRLAREKGVDLLLEAFAVLLRTHPQAHLTVLGTGPEAASLQQQVRGLSMEWSVSFPGFRGDLPSFYAQSTLFVLPSRYEGMPNALLEAAAAGLPLVTTPSSAGLCDLLRDAPGAWITREITASALAESILQALEALESAGDPALLFDHAFLAPFECSHAIAAYAACFGQDGLAVTT